jgi:hypothetical protein
MRRRIYEILTDPRPGDILGRAISLVLLALIAANVAANVIETDAEIAARSPSFFRTFEVISVAAFTVEYLLRLWSSPEDPRRVRSTCATCASCGCYACFGCCAPGGWPRRSRRSRVS